MRFFISLIYAIQIVSLTGVTDLAYAVSCSDVVDRQNAVTYQAALDKFVYYSGKTYAISKSASTGVSGSPDAYFAFGPGISRDYIYDGVDIASLKQLLLAGTYGAARPVKIKDAATKTFIIKQYGAKLGTSGGGSGGTLIDAWKERNASVFTDISGTALTYESWLNSLPPVEASSPDPSAVAMGNDGIFVPVSTGQKLAQVVEFDGKLDCAVDMKPLPAPTPSVGPTPTNATCPSGYTYNIALNICAPNPPPEAVPGQTINSTDPLAIQGVVCGMNLAADGQINNVGDIKNCLVAKKLDGTNGQFCPLGDLDCTTKFQEPICPSGSTLNPARDMCQKDPETVKCIAGYCIFLR